LDASWKFKSLNQIGSLEDKLAERRKIKVKGSRAAAENLGVIS